MSRGLTQRNPVLGLTVQTKSRAVALGERFREMNESDAPKYPIGMKPPIEEVKKSKLLLCTAWSIVCVYFYHQRNVYPHTVYCKAVCAVHVIL